MMVGAVTVMGLSVGCRHADEQEKQRQAARAEEEGRMAEAQKRSDELRRSSEVASRGRPIDDNTTRENTAGDFDRPGPVTNEPTPGDRVRDLDRSLRGEQKDLYGGGGSLRGSMGSMGGSMALTLEGDATAQLNSKAADQNLNGIAAFTTLADGTKLVVDVMNAKAGTYVIGLREDGKCDEPTARTKIVELGNFSVKNDGFGHFDQTLSKDQMKSKATDELANESLIIQVKPAPTELGGPGFQPRTEGIAKKGESVAACGVIIMSANRRPAT
jgi:hypothetical protein